MKRWMPPLVLLFLACAAVIAQLPGTAPDPTPFQRGSYAVLAQAESALAAGHPAQSLKALRVGYDRAQYEGQTAVAERIRRRMGLAGKALLPTNPEAAWPFLEAYALLGDDFTRDAAAVEGFCLSDPKTARPRFVYHLTRPDGRSYWGNRPEAEWRGLWPLWNGWKALTGKAQVSGAYLEAKPDWPQSSFTWLLSLPMRTTNRPPMPAFATLESPRNPSGPCWFQDNGPLQPALLQSSGRWQTPPIMTKPGQFLSRVLLFTQDLPPRKGLAMTLIHEYKPL